MLLGRAGFGDDFERDNFDYVQSAIAATPPTSFVRTPPSWLATPFAAPPPPPPPPPPSLWSALSNISAAAVAAVATPAPPPPSKSDYGASSNPFVPAQAPSSGLAMRGTPMLAPSVANVAPTGAPDMVSTPLVTTDAAAAAAQRTRWATLAIAGAAGLGLVLLLRR